MALNDMYNILHKHTIAGTTLLNVYQVERANAGETAGAISDAFQNSILPTLRLWQHTSIVNNELVILNLGDALDFGSFPLSSAAGLKAGSVASDFNAGSVKFNRLRSDMKNGFKRFAGVTEGEIAVNDLTAPAVILLDNIGTVMVANWLASADSHIVCNFVIIKRVCTTTPAEGDPCPQYRLPIIGDPLIFYTPTSGVGLASVRSQVSRRVRAS